MHEKISEKSGASLDVKPTGPLSNGEYSVHDCPIEFVTALLREKPIKATELIAKFSGDNITGFTKFSYSYTGIGSDVDLDVDTAPNAIDGVIEIVGNGRHPTRQAMDAVRMLIECGIPLKNLEFAEVKKTFIESTKSRMGISYDGTSQTLQLEIAGSPKRTQRKRIQSFLTK